jgi:hypothetical protein
MRRDPTKPSRRARTPAALSGSIGAQRDRLDAERAEPMIENRGYGF